MAERSPLPLSSRNDAEAVALTGSCTVSVEAIALLLPYSPRFQTDRRLETSQSNDLSFAGNSAHAENSADCCTSSVDFSGANDGPPFALLVTVALAKIKDDVEDRKRLRRVKDYHSSGWSASIGATRRTEGQLEGDRQGIASNLDGVTLVDVEVVR
jgi:hypothetical protein